MLRAAKNADKGNAFVVGYGPGSSAWAVGTDAKEIALLAAEGLFDVTSEQLVHDWANVGPLSEADCHKYVGEWAALARHGDGQTPAVESEWVNLSPDERMRYVVKRLVDRYDYPVNGAAGIVGNLSSESGVLPNRIEGSRPATPLRAKDFGGKSTDFTPEQVMNRNKQAGRGPMLPGIGLAQWTTGGRRAGLFTHVYDGKSHGSGVLFNMDAQIDYLVLELRNGYTAVRRVVLDPSVTVNAASDEVVYSFEIPGAILDSNHKKKLPRNDPHVQEVFTARRAASNRALRAYRGQGG